MAATPMTGKAAIHEVADIQKVTALRQVRRARGVIGRMVHWLLFRKHSIASRIQRTVVEIELGRGAPGTLGILQDLPGTIAGIKADSTLPAKACIVRAAL